VQIIAAIVKIVSVALKTLKAHMSRGTIPRAPEHYGGAESLREAPNVSWRRRKIPIISQVHSSIQSIFFRKTSGSNMGAPNLLLAPSAV